MDITYFTDEIWADIEGYEGLYQVSTKGNVRNSRTGRVLKSGRDKDGYQLVSLYTCGVSSTKKVHRLVAEAFVPNPENKPTVDHIDRNTSNNNVTNLRWATMREQYNNSNPLRPKTPIIATKDGIERMFCSQASCVETLNLTGTHVTACLKGRRKTHKGYTFKYLESSEILND